MVNMMMNGSVIKLLSQACPGPSVTTPFGEICADAGSLIGKIVNIGVGFGAVAAIALIAAGGFTILTSSGEPERLLNGKDMITNALMGLGLIILSVFVLELLGWDILGIGRITDVPFNSWT